MKERPILFKGEMVRAILDGRKTQTRRVMKQQFTEGETGDFMEIAHAMKDGIAYFWESEYPEEGSDQIKCPYGRPGDRLWVRETFNSDWCDKTIFKADGGSAKAAGFSAEPKWKPSIHMPRWASRINLEITNVRVERLCEIIPHDALAEGVDYPHRDDCPPDKRTLEAFQLLWDSVFPGVNDLNKTPTSPVEWGSNPWVWVIEFKRITP